MTGIYLEERILTYPHPEGKSSILTYIELLHHPEGNSKNTEELNEEFGARSKTEVMETVLQK